MTPALTALIIMGLLGATDTLYYHEWRLRLPYTTSAAGELRLHASRDFAYTVLFGSLGWTTWNGALVAIAFYFFREGRDLRSDGIEARALLVRKFRNPADAFLGIEDRFVTAQFLDYQGAPHAVNIRVPSRKWFWLREGSTETILY